MQKKTDETFSDINVTPLVDVMLVLLVIFMVTAPMMFNGINLSLPKTQKVNNLHLNAEKVILSISAGGDLYLGKEKFLKEEILNELKVRLKKDPANVIYIRAHENLKYGILAKLMSFLKVNGLSNIALVTEIEK